LSTALEFMLPWELSPTVLITITLAALLYARGLHALGAPPPFFRRAAFFGGLLSLYLPLQTAWDYYASHMFFVLQLQHFALHDLGPVLLAAAAPGAALARGLPRRLRGLVPAAARALRVPTNLLLDLRVATLLYVASQLLWLLPPVTFDVMLSDRLYRLMSWSTMLGALPFWHLILDPRPYPLSRLRLRYRFAGLYLAMLPMVLTSAALAFSQSNWYPVYAVCGRFLPISPTMDQELGGMAMWVPEGLLFGIVFFIFLGRKLDQTATCGPRGGPAAALKRAQRAPVAGKA
jgi:putative membrane protein